MVWLAARPSMLKAWASTSQRWRGEGADLLKALGQEIDDVPVPPSPNQIQYLLHVDIHVVVNDAVAQAHGGVACWQIGWG